MTDSVHTAGVAVAAQRAPSSHLVALAQALLVTFLWSSSWVLIKVGLNDLELRPLSFAGLRYVLAASLLLPFAVRGLAAARAARSGRPLLGRVVVLGVLLYAVAQGAQYAALVHLPAVAVSLLLTTTPAVVALASLRGGERPGPVQVLGIGALVVGAAVYFGPLDVGSVALLGLAIATVGVLANAAAALLGRALARDAVAEVGGALGLTALSMAVGSGLLLAAGLLIEGIPQLTVTAVLIVAWLAVVNTAVAFTLWNHTLRTLTAVQSSVINNLMLVQIAVLAWIFLDEPLTGVEIAGLATALAGILLVQAFRPSGSRTTARPAARAVEPMAAVEAAPDRRPAGGGRVLLVGMMGSGKTTVGRLLSQRTGWPYVDNDVLLQRLFGLTAREILVGHGEDRLRVMESEALALGLAEPSPCIVGVPAGTILGESDRRRLRTAGTVVWLRGRPETLAARAAGGSHRPWLEGGAEAWMRATLEEREPLYRSVADIIVDVDDRTPAQIVDALMEQLDGGPAERRG